MAKITHIIIPVSNMQSGKEFYIDKLGLELVTENLEAMPPSALLKNKEGDNIMLVSDPFAGEGNSAPRVTVGWSVGNLAELKGALESKGMKFDTDIVEVEGSKVLNFRDPDGHTMQLMESV